MRSTCLKPLSPVILAVIFLVVVTPAALASREMNLAAYRAMVGDQQSIIDSLLRSLSDKRDIEIELDALIRNAARNGALIVREGECAISLDHSWVHRELKRARSERRPAQKGAILKELNERLGSVARATAQMGELQPPDPEARAVLAAILSGSEFRYTPKKESWWQRQREKMESIGRAIGKALAGILRILLNVPVAIGVILAATGYMVYRLWWKAPRRAVGDSPPARVTLLATGPEGYLKRAENAATNADYRQAIRQIYLALLARLDRAGYIQYVPWRTNREYLRSIREKSPGMVGAFEPITGLYEHKWYGLERCSRPDYDEGLRLYRRALHEGGL